MTEELLLGHRPSQTGHASPSHTSWSLQTNPEVAGKTVLDITWQDGPVKKFGVNGVQNKDVLEIVLERLKTQKAAHSCHENEMALVALESAIGWLLIRTQELVARSGE